MADVQTCRRCGAEKPLDAFYRDSRVKSGHTTTCKDCKRERYSESRKAYDRAYSTANPGRNNESKRTWRLNNPDYYRGRKGSSKLAHWQVANALERGDLLKPSRCESCSKETRSLDAHHDDYDKPLDVRWLCRTCHRLVHAGRAVA